MKRIGIVLAVFGLAVSQGFAQTKQWNGTEILHRLKKLNVMGSVLYVAAHPDDENTRLITWLSNEKLVETAYISLTRGSGGQNLIGGELGDELGVIRTHELLQARSVDGGYQYFSRALDFGYTKSVPETFKTWKKRKILGDLMWVIRRFQPDVVITRFSSEPGRTHGHHTSSAILAGESFEIGLDTNEFYKQLKYVEPWKPERVLWNTSSWFYRGDDNVRLDTFIQVDVGTFNPLLGASYTEIAALSRSKHKSQGFGSTGSRGETLEYFIVSNGTRPENNDLLSGIDLTWGRVKDGKKIGDKLAAIIKKFDPEDPAASVPDLLDVHDMMNKLEDKTPLVIRKMEECRELIRQCMGFYMDVYTDDYIYAVGDTIRLKVETINRSSKYLSYFSLKLPGQGKWLVQDFVYNRQVSDATNQKWTSQNFLVKDDAPISNPPWWGVGSLEGDYEKYVQSLESQMFPYMEYKLWPSFNGENSREEFYWSGTIMQRINDRVKGEVRRPVYIAPPITANFDEPVYIQPGAGAKKIYLELEAFKPNVNGTLSLDLPQGWKCEPKSVSFDLKRKREKLRVEFTVTAHDSSASGDIKPVLQVDGNTYQVGFKEIEYDHIPTVVVFPPAVSKLVNVSVKRESSKIAYIHGAGDAVPHALLQLGYQVDILDPNSVQAEALSGYKAVIVGIRAYNTLDNILFIQQELLKYSEQGGNVIVQYITARGMKTKEIGPYPFKVSYDRVTDQKAPMVFLDKTHPVVNKPNKITEADFENWVQERGLYFAQDWDEAYTPIFGCNDPGKDEMQGCLIIAEHGKGHFVYTGISFFRQLPAGVPGAYRLMVNLIEL